MLQESSHRVSTRLTPQCVHVWLTVQPVAVYGMPNLGRLLAALERARTVATLKCRSDVSSKVRQTSLSFTRHAKFVGHGHRYYQGLDLTLQALCHRQRGSRHRRAGHFHDAPRLCPGLDTAPCSFKIVGAPFEDTLERGWIIMDSEAIVSRTPGTWIDSPGRHSVHPIRHL